MELDIAQITSSLYLKVHDWVYAVNVNRPLNFAVTVGHAQIGFGLAKKIH